MLREIRKIQEAMKVSLAASIALLAAFLVQPMTLLLASGLKISPSSFQSASELASIMGAIFTSGGLVVALLSLYTMANVDKASEDAVERKFHAVPERIDERIRTFMEAYFYLEEARRLWSQYKYQELPAIENFVLRAEETEPTLRNLNTWIGKLFSNPLGPRICVNMHRIEVTTESTRIAHRKLNVRH
jgi:hypothetical protein